MSYFRLLFTSGLAMTTCLPLFAMNPNGKWQGFGRGYNFTSDWVGASIRETNCDFQFELSLANDVLTLKKQQVQCTTSPNLGEGWADYVTRVPDAAQDEWDFRVDHGSLSFLGNLSGTFGGMITDRAITIWREFNRSRLDLRFVEMNGVLGFVYSSESQIPDTSGRTSYSRRSVEGMTGSPMN